METESTNPNTGRAYLISVLASCRKTDKETSPSGNSSSTGWIRGIGEVSKAVVSVGGTCKQESADFVLPSFEGKRNMKRYFIMDRTEDLSEN